MDEAPQAYKDPEEIIEAIEPTNIVIEHIQFIVPIKDKSGNKRNWKEFRIKKKRERSVSATFNVDYENQTVEG